ncbi:RNA polymerase sigma-70 factor, ECF subfamily [Lachnospiraceae bacterium]|nr:RNA polymerase sigma-70 factor, ECF subfamily [Lachnospiraceae bacterium]
MTRIETTFEGIYADNFSYVYNMFYMKLLHRETAEDLTSQTFLNAYSHFNEFNSSRASARTWLCTIARNLMIDYFRRNAIRPDTPTETLPELPVEDEYSVLKDPINQEVRFILSHIREEERELIAMRYGMDLSPAEISKILGISSKAVTERIRRLLEKSRKIEKDRNLADIL